jgi:hypothetical protein
MKKSILIIAAMAFAATATFTGCTTPTQKVENAEENVQKANEELAKAKQEYLTDVDSYRRQTDTQISTNDQMLADLKTIVAKERAETRTAYLQRISVLEQKNLEMKNKMRDYRGDNQENWKTFKSDFSRDMDQLGKDLKDFFVKK